MLQAGAEAGQGIWRRGKRRTWALASGVLPSSSWPLADACAMAWNTVLGPTDGAPPGTSSLSSWPLCSAN
jgi:hypothetical protein